MKYSVKWHWFASLISILACNDTSTNKAPINYTNHDTASANVTVVRSDTTMFLIIDEMIRQLSSKQLSGDVDYDYANTVISIDKAGVEMARSLLSKSQDVELRKFASRLLEVRKGRIARLTEFYQTDLSHVSPGASDYQAALKAAISEVQKNIPAGTPNIDKDFALRTLQIEKMLMVVAEADLKYGSIQTLKIISRSIISYGDENINRVTDWISKNQSI